jgi:hypothetical protein
MVRPDERMSASSVKYSSRGDPGREQDEHPGGRAAVVGEGVNPALLVSYRRLMSMSFVPYPPGTTRRRGPEGDAAVVKYADSARTSREQ